VRVCVGATFEKREVNKTIQNHGISQFSIGERILCTCICIYIYREREREGEIFDIHVSVYIVGALAVVL